MTGSPRHGAHHGIRPSWLRSERAFPRAVVRPALRLAEVEAAIAGVIFGLLTPTEPFHDRTYRVDAANQLIARLDNDETTVDEVARYLLETEAPLTRIEQRLNLWIAFVVVPLFALVNAGVGIDLGSLETRVTVGVALGLLVGKSVGVSLGAYIAVRLGLGRLPDATTWRHMVGLAVTSGIGVTVALYIAGLSFTDDALVASAKSGIIIGSVCAGALGFALLRATPSPRPGAVDVTGRQPVVGRAAAPTN
jgi:NhaA family Na+:H+ antiporter